MVVKKMRDHVRKRVHDVVHQESSPESIAAGFAVGIAIGVLPSPGFGTILALALVLLFPKLSKLAVFAGLAVLNPLIEIPLFGVSLFLGSWLLGSPQVPVHDLSIIQQIMSQFEAFLLGNLIIAVILTTTAYFSVLYAVRALRKKKAKAKKV